jgi:hypothetical protein
MTALTRLEQAWYAPAPPSRLGLLRIAVGGYWLYRLVDTRAKMFGVVRADPANWDPMGLAHALPGALLPEIFDVAYDATIVLCVAWTLGIAWRAVAPAFAVLLLAVMSYRLSFGHLHHESHLPTLHVVALSLTPASVSLSLDAWLRRCPSPEGAASWRWGWPVQLVSAITVCSYTAAGVAKITGGGGLAWGSTLLGHLGYVALSQDLLASGGRDAVRFLFEHPSLAPPLGLGALVLELGAGSALLDRRIAALWVCGMIGVHWGILMVMGIVFPYPLCGVAFLSFFPIERLIPKRLTSRSWAVGQGGEGSP